MTDYIYIVVVIEVITLTYERRALAGLINGIDFSSDIRYVPLLIYILYHMPQIEGIMKGELCTLQVHAYVSFLFSF